MRRRSRQTSPPGFLLLERLGLTLIIFTSEGFVVSTFRQTDKIANRNPWYDKMTLISEPTCHGAGIFLGCVYIYISIDLVGLYCFCSVSSSSSYSSSTTSVSFSFQINSVPPSSQQPLVALFWNEDMINMDMKSNIVRNHWPFFDMIVGFSGALKFQITDLRADLQAYPSTINS